MRFLCDRLGVFILQTSYFVELMSCCVCSNRLRDVPLPACLNVIGLSWEHAQCAAIANQFASPQFVNIGTNEGNFIIQSFSTVLSNIRAGFNNPKSIRNYIRICNKLQLVCTTYLRNIFERVIYNLNLTKFKYNCQP